MPGFGQAGLRLVTLVLYFNSRTEGRDTMYHVLPSCCASGINCFGEDCGQHVRAGGRLPLVAQLRTDEKYIWLLSNWQPSTRIRTVEVLIAFGVCARLWSAKVSMFGSAGTALMFLTTFSFLLSAQAAQGGDMVLWRSSDQSRLDSDITL
jgi:hypothetical protein